ncbi:MAG: glyoxalase [Balneolaceae bacterium]|nr:glyoxalase [Balneolaceae bacterium]
MPVKRTVPNIKSPTPASTKDFFEGFLEMDVVMEREEIITYANSDDLTATQVSVIRHDELNSPVPDISIEVDDVDRFYKKATEQAIEIIYPLTDEPWRVRRFFAKSPNGKIINILNHI